MLKTCLLINFSDDFRYQRSRLKDLIEYLSVEIPVLTETDLFDLRVIYNELITNAIVHGNDRDYSKNVELLIEIENYTITSSVRDEGDGFDYSKLSGAATKMDNLLKETGRGLQLVFALSDMVQWNDIGNEVTFLKSFKQKKRRIAK